MPNNLKDLLVLIEEKSNIVDVLSDYITLEKKGNSHVGLCPFHGDSNPSLSVSTSKGIYKCFSCGAGGRTINFVQNYEGVSFIEAVKKLSEKYNIDWKKYINSYEPKTNKEELRGWQINKESLNFFSYNLKNIKDKKVIDYLKKRDINKGVIDKFKIGFSSKENSLSNYLLKKGFSDDEIVKYGLAKRSNDSTLYDYFINRIIFPIFDVNNNVVGFSGREFEKSEYTKYLNSPETPIFKKSEVLYNLNNAKISGNLKKEVIIVEGFMDVIALSKIGIQNSIATMGTALTNSHLLNLKKITNNFSLAFDSDDPGIRATISIAKKMILENINVKVIKIPNEKDFDEIYSNNKNLIPKIIQNKKDFFTFYKELIYKQNNIKKEVSLELIRELLKTLIMYNDNLLIDQTINELSKKYNFKPETLSNEINKIKSYPTSQNNDSNKLNSIPKIIKKTTREKKISEINHLKILLYILETNNIEAIKYIKNNPIHWEEGYSKDLWENIEENHGLNKIDIKNNIDKINSQLSSLYSTEEEKELIKDFKKFKQWHAKIIDIKIKSKEFKKRIAEEKFKTYK